MTFICTKLGCDHIYAPYNSVLFGLPVVNIYFHKSICINYGTRLPQKTWLIVEQNYPGTIVKQGGINRTFFRNIHQYSVHKPQR